MNNKTFKAEGQNVFVTYTGGGSRVFTELYCIAVSVEVAQQIVSLLNPSIK